MAQGYKTAKGAEAQRESTVRRRYSKFRRFDIMAATAKQTGISTAMTRGKIRPGETVRKWSASISMVVETKCPAANNSGNNMRIRIFCIRFFPVRQVLALITRLILIAEPTTRRLLLSTPCRSHLNKACRQSRPDG